MHELLTSPFVFGFVIGVLISLIFILIKDMIELICNKLQQNAKKD